MMLFIPARAHDEVSSILGKVRSSGFREGEAQTEAGHICWPAVGWRTRVDNHGAPPKCSVTAHRVVFVCADGDGAAAACAYVTHAAQLLAPHEIGKHQKHLNVAMGKKTATKNRDEKLAGGEPAARTSEPTLRSPVPASPSHLVFVPVALSHALNCVPVPQYLASLLPCSCSFLDIDTVSGLDPPFLHPPESKIHRQVLLPVCICLSRFAGSEPTTKLYRQKTESSVHKFSRPNFGSHQYVKTNLKKKDQITNPKYRVLRPNAQPYRNVWIRRRIFTSLGVYRKMTKSVLESASE